MTGVKHVYEVTAIKGDFPNVEIGGHMIDGGHVRKAHEPYRVWSFLNPSAKVNDGDPFTSITARHIGEWEKVKPLIERLREMEAKLKEGEQTGVQS